MSVWARIVSLSWLGSCFAPGVVLIEILGHLQAEVFTARHARLFEINPQVVAALISPDLTSWKEESLSLVDPESSVPPPF